MGWRSLFFGAPSGIRTPDTLLKRQVLYRLSLRSVCYKNRPCGPVYIWQGWLDSNQRMRESKSLALPLGDTPVRKKEIRDQDIS